jgi:hypothetical protein
MAERAHGARPVDRRQHHGIDWSRAGFRPCIRQVAQRPDVGAHDAVVRVGDRADDALAASSRRPQAIDDVDVTLKAGAIEIGETWVMTMSPAGAPQAARGAFLPASAAPRRCNAADVTIATRRRSAAAGHEQGRFADRAIRAGRRRQVAGGRSKTAMLLLVKTVEHSRTRDRRG